MSDGYDVPAPAPADLAIRPAAPAGLPRVIDFVHKLAEYERLAHEVRMDESSLQAL